MSFDVDLFRNLLLRLESRQISPRAAVIILAQTEAEVLGVDRFMIIESLNYLKEHDYIEGPGMEGEEIWLFRKLTSKGRKFVTAAREPADWKHIKDRQMFGKREPYN